MQRNFDSFYQPYVSDSEDSASITSSDTSDSEESMKLNPIGSTKFLTQVGGINLNPPAKQLDLRVQPRVKGPARGMEYSAFDLSGVADPSLPFTGTSFDMTNGTYTSILMINSRDRDTHVYAQPTFFTIRLPRTYRNVTSFQITQMKLLSSFFYFRPDKENVTLSVLEQGRTVNVGGQTVDNVITVTIRTGTYNIDTLLAEIQTQLNRTPLFFYYPNGFSDFITQFTAAGDLSVNFNLPGDTYFNSLNDTFVANPTIEQITQQYFATRYAGLSIYTLNQVKVAYYYPVIYEMLLDPEFENSVNLTLSPTGPQLLPGETVRSRVLYTFQGLNDLVIQEIINNNLAIPAPSGYTGSILDFYRTQNTFVYSLVNEYNCTYETNNNRIVISTTRLNTSLFNLLNNQAAIALADVLSSNGLTLQQYSNLLLSNTLYTSVFTGMYNTLQSNFATYFAVNFGTYSPIFYTNISNTPFLQNGIGAVGVATGYTLAVLQSGQEPISSSAQNLQSAPGYWPQIVAPPNNAKNTNDGSNNVIFIGSGIAGNGPGGVRQQDLCANFLNIPYNTIAGTLLNTTKMIDNSGNIYISPTFGAGDCVTPVYNSKYTVFRFRSFVRQTLQVETLPLPYYYRYPDVNKLQFSNTTEYPGIVAHFDLSYSYINSPYLTRTDISGFNPVFAQSYGPAFSNGKDFLFTVRSNVRYYSFQAPAAINRYDSNTQLTDSSGYKYPLRLNLTCTNPLGLPTRYPSPMDIYLYHDQGAFFADISQNRNESPYNYKYTTETSTDLSNAYIDFNAISQNTYYMIVRSRDISFENTRLRPFAYFPEEWGTPIVRYFYNKFIDPYISNVPLSYPASTDASYNWIYATYYDPDFIRLPTSSNLMGPDPTSQSFNQFLPTSVPAIGYDISGVSNDLTDYRGFQSNVLGNDPNVAFAVDPINRFSFQNLSVYNTEDQSYFYTGSSNAILQPITNQPYTPKTVEQRQYKIVHWYDTNYVAPQKFQRGLPDSNFVAKARVFDNSYGDLNFYTYDASGNIGSATGGLSFQQGIAGIGFLPNEGVWDLDAFVLKTAYMERPLLSGNYTDPNKNIKFLGVFPNNFVNYYLTSDLSLNNAIVKLNYSTSVTYTPEVQLLNQGFDNVGGTYHLFEKDTTFVPTTRFLISGYTPSVTYDFDSNNYYSLVAFDSNGQVVPFYTPMGSYIPYPKVTVACNVITFTDKSGLYQIPNSDPQFSNNSLCNYGFYAPFYPPSTSIVFNPSGPLSNFYPQDGSGAIYQSRYQQSIPIQTSLVTSLAETSIVSYSNSFNYYPTQSNPITTLIPSAFTNWCNSDPILYMTKGPYFFWVDDADLQTGFLYITSNANLAAKQSNVNFRATTLVATPRRVQAITRSGDYTPATVGGNPPNSNVVLALTTNNSGSTDLSGIYALVGSRYPVSTLTLNASPLIQSFPFAFYTASLSFDPNNSNSSPTFSRKYTSNAGAADFLVPLKYGSIGGLEGLSTNVIKNSPLYTSNFGYSKFNFRENIGNRGESGALMFQFAQEYDHNINTYPADSFNEGTQSIWGIVECSGNTCRSLPTVVERVGFPWPYIQALSPGSGYNNRYLNAAFCMSDGGFSGSAFNFYWDFPRGQTLQPTPPFFTPFLYNPILDWVFTEDGLLYVNKGQLANPVGAFLTGSRYTSLANEYASNNIQAELSNFPIIQQIGFSTPPTNGVFNQLSTDLSGTIYLQQGCLPSITMRFDISGQMPQGLISQGWGLNEFGRYVQGTGYKSYYDFQNSNGGSSNQPVLIKGASTVSPTIFDDQFTVNSLLVCQSICPTTYKSDTTLKPIFFQICNRQNFFFSQTNILITDSIPITQSDISGTYNITFNGQPTFGPPTPIPFFTIQGLPAGADIVGLEQAIFRSFSNLYGYDSNTTEQFLSNFPFQFGQPTFATNIYTLPVFFGSPVTNITTSGGPVYNLNTLSNIFFFPQSFGFKEAQTVTFPFVQGNSAVGVDRLPSLLSNNWQVFYPTCKFVLRKLDQGSTPITNTFDLIGSNNQPPDTFEHTTMFYYDNYTDLSNDIFNKFGRESKARFKNFDVSSGYGFHSYIYNIPLEAYKGNTLDVSANKGYNYLAIRGYSPCEKFNCLTRFYLPGRYDFGFISLKDLSNETQTVLVELSGSRLVNPVYQTVLNAFNNSFKGTFTFGSNAVAGFNGSNYTFTGFPSFLNTYIQTYNTGNSNAELLASITSNVNQRVAAYIQTYLGNILPSYVLTRERFTDPLLFSFLFKSALSDVRKDLEYEWGLGWNLGYPKIDTPYDTIQRATSFFKILDDYIYLKLNQEFWMNRLDSSGPENLSVTHEPTGQTNQFAAKLLLANFGSYAQTMIQNPVSFNPVLTAIDKLTFQWVDIAGVQINNFDCEWNAAVQITEQVTQATPMSTIPRAQAKK